MDKLMKLWFKCYEHIQKINKEYLNNIYKIMIMRNFHLTYIEKHWELKEEAPKDYGIAFTPFCTKKDALKQSIAFCKEEYASIGKPISLKIHKKNGQIQSERTYPRSVDPKKSKG